MGKGFCFVIMQFTDDKQLNYVFDRLLKPTMEELGYICQRCDTQDADRLIDQRIIKGITESEIIIADLTNARPNVFYELGIAHTHAAFQAQNEYDRKQIILISQDEPPFDIKSCDVIIYDPGEVLTEGSEDTCASKAFKEAIKKAVRSVQSTNPVAEFKPKYDSVLSHFALKYLRKKYDPDISRLVLVDLDGTLFNSTTHRKRASILALHEVVPGTTEELAALYDDIYLKHIALAKVMHEDVRYNWLTKQIYRIAYFKHQNGRFPYGHREYFSWSNALSYEIVAKAESALAVFKSFPMSPTSYASGFLRDLQTLGFQLYLFTEGDRKIQEWKLEKLGLSQYFPQRQRRHIGVPFSSSVDLELEYYSANLSCDGKCRDFCNLVKSLHGKIIKHERAITIDGLFEAAIKEHGQVRFAVVGDRYDIDLAPFQCMFHSNAIRIGVTDDAFEKYATEMKKCVQEECTNRGLSGESARIHVVENLRQAFELIANPEIWRSVGVTKQQPPLGADLEKESIEQLHQMQLAGKIIEHCRFRAFADEILKWQENRSGRVTQDS